MCPAGTRERNARTSGAAGAGGAVPRCHTFSRPLIVLIYGFGFRTNPAFHRGCSLITGAGAWPSFNLHLEEKNHFIYFTFSTYLFLFFVTLLNLWPLFLRFFIAH